MPETWNVVESGCEKEVCIRHGRIRKACIQKNHTSHSGKRDEGRVSILRGGTMKKSYPAWQEQKDVSGMAGYEKDVSGHD